MRGVGGQRRQRGPRCAGCRPAMRRNTFGGMIAQRGQSQPRIGEPPITRRRNSHRRHGLAADADTHRGAGAIVPRSPPTITWVPGASDVMSPHAGGHQRHVVRHDDGLRAARIRPASSGARRRRCWPPTPFPPPPPPRGIGHRRLRLHADRLDRRIGHRRARRLPIHRMVAFAHAALRFGEDPELRSRAASRQQLRRRSHANLPALVSSIACAAPVRERRCASCRPGGRSACPASAVLMTSVSPVTLATVPGTRAGAAHAAEQATQARDRGRCHTLQHCLHSAFSTGTKAL